MNQINMTSLADKLLVNAWTSSFTFDLPLPQPQLQANPNGALETSIFEQLAMRRSAPGFRSTVYGGIELTLSDNGTAHVWLQNECDRDGGPAVRITLSPATVSHSSLHSLGSALRALMGDDFEIMCRASRAVGMTITVELSNLSFAQVLPRFQSSGGRTVESRKHNQHGLKQIVFYSDICGKAPSSNFDHRVFEVHGKELDTSWRPSIDNSALIRQVKNKSEDGPALIFEQEYELDLRMTQLAQIQGNLHRLDFAEFPFSEAPKLPKAEVREFFQILENKGVDAAMYWSSYIDARVPLQWWKSRRAEWWNPIEAWDDCVVDLPVIGDIIAFGFGTRK